MVNYARVQYHIDKGLKIAGRKVGQPWTAHRIDATANGDFPGGWASVGNVNALPRRITEGKLQSALEYAGTVWYDIIGGMAPFLLGDVFTCTDPPYVPGVSYGEGATQIVGGSQYELLAYTLVWHMPVNRPVGARIDRRCQIFRAPMSPDTTYGGTNTWRQANDRSEPLVLEDGVYSFRTFGSATASFVPVGLSSTARPGKGENFPPHVPGMTGITRYYAFLPPLPGYEPKEADRLIAEDGARYIVLNPYKQEVGVVGSQLALERMIGQVA